VAVAWAGSRFSDHWIRVVNADESYPE